MTRPLLLRSDHCPLPLPPGHRFPLTKYARVYELLRDDDRFDFAPAPEATREQIELAHDPAYVRSFLDGTLDRAAIRRIGFPWSEGLVRRTLVSAGATLAATDWALQHRWGGSLAGGTHHAFYAAGSGFCVFNDIAIAIQWLRARGLAARAAVIDLDVHQGDGTAEIFHDDPAVLTFSMHGRNNFPFRKQTSRIDIELDDHTADDIYLDKLAATLPRVFSFDPQVVFYQSGVDALATDTLGRLALTPHGLSTRDRLVAEAAVRHGAPFIITLGGGYSNPIEATALAHANTYRIAASVFT